MFAEDDAKHYKFSYLLWESEKLPLYRPEKVFHVGRWSLSRKWIKRETFPSSAHRQWNFQFYEANEKNGENPELDFAGTKIQFRFINQSLFSPVAYKAAARSLAHPTHALPAPLTKPDNRWFSTFLYVFALLIFEEGSFSRTRASFSLQHHCAGKKSWFCQQRRSSASFGTLVMNAVERRVCKTKNLSYFFSLPSFLGALIFLILTSSDASASRKKLCRMDGRRNGSTRRQAEQLLQQAIDVWSFIIIVCYFYGRFSERQSFGLIRSRGMPNVKHRGWSLT